jgi:hypothetical protein
MPSRWLSASILAFWLATTGWLVWHDLWPIWRSGEPPPYHIDLVEEVQKGDRLRTFWDIQRLSKDQKTPVNVFRGSTWIEYRPDDDTFALHAKFQARKDSKLEPFKLMNFAVETITSEYRVNRAGQLRALEAEVNVGTSSASRSLAVRIWGEVIGDKFHAHIRGSIGSVDWLNSDPPPSPLSHNGSVLMPLHPVNRIQGLRLGQTWRQPLIDPFRDAIPGLSKGVRYVNARVLPQPQILKLNQYVQVSCLVVEYESEGEKVGATWVEEDSERVQRQEAILEKNTWIMKRDNLHKRPDRRISP